MILARKIRFLLTVLVMAALAYHPPTTNAQGNLFSQLVEAAKTEVKKKAENSSLA